MLQSKMKPVENWTMEYQDANMKDGTDVTTRIDVNRNKVIAKDKR